jgi:hypothetical protein
MRFLLCGAALAAAGALFGCASIAEGTTQPIMVMTTPVSGATCTLTNTQGKWSVVTPGSVVVKKSASVMKAVCVKDGWQQGTGYLAARVPGLAQAGMMVPYVGILSAAVDGSTGAANEYPSMIEVSMKQTTTAPSATPPATGAAASQAASAK